MQPEPTREALIHAVKRMHAARGRYHSQHATCDLYELLGLPCTREAGAPEAAPAAEPDRYKVVRGSESGHCCFKATVVDTTRRLDLSDDDDEPYRWEPVCECLDHEDAERIVAALNAESHPQAQVVAADLQAEIDRLNAIINTPHSDDFIQAVSIEAEHQRQRWGAEGDAGKTPADWFWLVGYLAGKALHAHAAGNAEKAEHHVITTAAACANWHRAMFGLSDMRPGIDARAQGGS